MFKNKGDNSLKFKKISVKMYRITTFWESLRLPESTRTPQNYSFSYFCIIFFFLNLSLAALGLLCSVPVFSGCVKRGLLFIEVRGLLIAVASLVVEHGLWVRGFQ